MITGIRLLLPVSVESKNRADTVLFSYFSVCCFLEKYKETITGKMLSP